MLNSAVTIEYLGQIEIVCGDLERAVAFYRDVLGLEFLFSAPPGLAFFQLGQTRLMLARPEGERPAGGSVLYFKVTDCQAAIDIVRLHSNVVDEPHLIAHMGNHELWMAFFHDTEGNLRAFMEERAV